MYLCLLCWIKKRHIHIDTILRSIKEHVKKKHNSWLIQNSYHYDHAIKKVVKLVVK